MMADAYVVRFIEGHDFVGIFVAEPKHLFWLVDESCDPGMCEYARLPWGGIFSSSAKDTPHIPLRGWKGWDGEDEPPEDGESILVGGEPMLTEVWAGKLEDGDLRWKPVPLLEGRFNHG